MFIILLFAMAALCVFFVPAMAVWLMVVGRRRRRGGRAFTRAITVAGVMLLMLDGWVIASGIAEFSRMRQFMRCQENLGRHVLIHLEEWAQSHPGEPLPTHWTGEEPESKCEGSGEAKSYVILPVASDEKGNLPGDALLAYCPHPHRRYGWTMFKLDDDRDRICLFGRNRHLENMREQDIRDLLEQTERR